MGIFNLYVKSEVLNVLVFAIIDIKWGDNFTKHINHNKKGNSLLSMLVNFNVIILEYRQGGKLERCYF